MVRSGGLARSNPSLYSRGCPVQASLGRGFSCPRTVRVGKNPGPFAIRAARNVRCLFFDSCAHAPPQLRSSEKIMLDWSKCAAVESIPGKLSGAWVFRGTRIPVSAVFENLEDGLTIDEIVKMFDGLSKDLVVSVLEFAAQSLDAPLL